MKRFFSSFIISYFPLIVFLATVLYGCLKIDFGDNSQHDPYGWYFVIFFFLPTIYFYGVSLLFNFLKGLVFLFTEKTIRGKVMGLLYGVATFLIALSLRHSLGLVMGLTVFMDSYGSGPRVWKMVFSISLLSLPLLDWLIRRQQNPKEEK